MAITEIKNGRVTNFWRMEWYLVKRMNASLFFLINSFSAFTGTSVPTHGRSSVREHMWPSQVPHFH